MKKPIHEQTDAQPADKAPPPDLLESDNRESDQFSNSPEFDDAPLAEGAPAQSGRLVGIFLMGFLAAILLSALSYFLVIRPRGNNPVAPTASNSDQTIPEGGSLVNATGLNLETQHPDGTILRVEGISFDSTKTTVHLTAINTKNPGEGRIRLNQTWGTIRNTMVLKDGFGGEYPLIAAGGNPDFEVKPGQTITGAFNFSGKMNPAARTVTLVTNSKGGSPTNSISQTPLIQLQIPVSHTYP
ncbi:MAG: hypothetical protein QNJ46_07670 [Leptolyngbyaceae cyanobacterium MO_188.B28]|nr:hypothetical protein [Leptolyngbyaceae cyanobacterium MO_188.B28]